MERRRSRHPGARVRAAATATALVLPAALLVSPGSPAAAAVAGVDVTYTNDADFDQGALADVNHAAPNHHQLQLDRTTTPFPFVNVAASARGTMVRIDVDTGQVLGEYRTAPDSMGRNPSRTTVDRLGNVWVTNRQEASGARGSVARIGLVTGGTRTGATGTPDPSGEYVSPPFAYNTCQDRDGDGRLRTSAGLGDIRPWTNAGGADSLGGVSTAEDECIINYTRTAGTFARTVAVDQNNDVWVGGMNTRHEKIDGGTGAPVPGTQFELGCGGYGGLIDLDGNLWSARAGSGLLRYEPAAVSGACLGNANGDYGLGLDPVTGEVWHTALTGNRVVKLATDGTVLGSFAHGFEFAQGVAVDRQGNVWVAHSLLGGATTVGHLRTDGTYVGNVSLPGGQGPTGVSVDANGKVWVANLHSNDTMRIDPSAGPLGGGGFPVGAVDLVVPLGAGAGPYNYSDMTGSVLGTITAPQGTWNVVQDGGSSGMPWGTVTWNTEPQGSEPPGTTITVAARAADSVADLAAQPYAAVGNGVPASLVGRFIEVRTTLTAAANGTSPVLSDLRIQSANRPPVCEGTPSTSTLWPPNHKFVPVTVEGVTDPDGDPTTTVITSIRQDEPTDTHGDGRFAPDGRGVGTSTAEVRAERVGTRWVPGDGRVYHVGYTATDPHGGQCSGTVAVGVPHDQRGDTPVDGGPLFDSTS